MPSMSSVGPSPWEGMRPPWPPEHGPQVQGRPVPRFGPDGQELQDLEPQPGPVGSPGLAPRGPPQGMPPGAVFLPGSHMAPTMPPPGPLPAPGYTSMPLRPVAPQIVRHIQAVQDVEVMSEASPEWAGLDRSPMRPGFCDVASDKGSVALGSMGSVSALSQVEDAASEAARALRAIAEEAEAKYANLEVLAHQARHEQVLLRMAEELVDLRMAHQALAQAQEKRHEGPGGTASQVEVLQAITLQAQVERTATSEVMAQLSQELSELRQLHATHASHAGPLQPQRTSHREEPVRVGKTIVEEAVNVKGVKGVEMESTVPVVPVPKQTVTSDGGEVKAMPREEPGSFVDRDVMKAVEKARAAVVELQRHAGLLEGPSVSDTNSVATTQVRSCSPFCQEAVGLNILLSHDGYTATRSSGCRQSVAVCKAPLSLQAEGWYFEVEVLQTVDGWLGGLGIGVTQADPSEMKDQRLPDKACRMPKTYILGYVGSKYLNGSCEFIDWQPGLLQVGQRVGLLIARTTNDLVVNVDGEEVAKVSGDDLRSKGFSTEPMYGIVDVYNATLSIRLLAGAVAPSRKGH